MDERTRRVERFFEWPALIAAILVIPVIVIDEADFREPLDTLAAVANWAIWLVFAAELVAVLAVVPDRRRWALRHPIDLAVVVLTPPFLPVGLQALRVLRLLLLVRLFRVARMARHLFSLEGLEYAALVTLLVAVVGGAAFAAIEDTSAWDGIYWCVTTMTTVGSDIQPRTTGGEVLEMLVPIVGLAFIAFLTGAIARRFIEPSVEEVVDEVAEIEGTEDALRRQVTGISRRLREIGAELEQLSTRLETRDRG